MPCAFEFERKIDGKKVAGCQFNTDESGLIEHDGKGWCPFHAPMESSKKEWNEQRISAFNESIHAFIATAKTAVGEADLSGVVFPGEIDFSQYLEENALPPIAFRRATFSSCARFGKATFSGHAVFYGATFSSAAGFHEATFSDGASFGWATFSNNLWFDETTFSGHAEFNEAKFNGASEFREATFSGPAWFRRTTFSDYVTFHKATFSDRAEFGEAALNYAWFDETTFSGPAEFGEATFSNDAVFSTLPSGNSGTTTPPSDVFHGASFAGAEFGKAALFTNRRFLDKTDFSGGFFARAPEFHNCELHQDTDFSGRKFRDTTSHGAVRAYRTLKLAMESVRARAEQAQFFALEQKSLRARADTPAPVKLFSWLYEVTADYGQSFMKPLASMVAVFVIFYWIYQWLLVGDVLTGPEHVQRVGTITLKQTFNPTFVFRNAAAIKAGSELSLVFWAGVHTLLNVSFLSLFILAVRRRFTMR